MFGKKKAATLTGSLIDGLPVPLHSAVVVSQSVEGLKFTAIVTDGKAYRKEFNLPAGKVKSVRLLNEKEINEVVYQSVPGMILGAAAFGVVGAMVGGRIQTKEKTTLKQILVVDYFSEEAKQIVLDCSGESAAGQAAFMKGINSAFPYIPDNSTIQL